MFDSHLITQVIGDDIRRLYPDTHGNDPYRAVRQDVPPQVYKKLYTDRSGRNRPGPMK